MKRIERIFAAVAMLTVVAIIFGGCTKPDDPNGGGNGENGEDNDTLVLDHDYVDLGLPSGILWATCNVGASCPEDRGDYFAWGETVTKELYDWKSYKYGAYDGECYMLNKYCSVPSYGINGFIDSLSILESIDDAVRANWGADWRMATGEEWDELYKNTEWIWTTQNGVEGRLLTGSNGNSIFLPSTGFYLDGELICTDLGIYWTSSLQKAAPVSAWSLHFNYENCHVCGTYERSRGQCVRAVRSVK